MGDALYGERQEEDDMPLATVRQEIVRRTDAELQQDVLRELKWDARVEETDVGVEVDEGVVTLSGTVSSWGKRFAAEEAAHRVRGVMDVANDIVVKLPGTPGRTDTELAHAVRNALMWDVFVPAARVQSTVSDGVVTLEGELDSWIQRVDAEKAVRNLAGVRSVRNQIVVKPPQVSSTEVHNAIEQALNRQAEREVKRIRLEIRNGEVTLSGLVRSWAEKQAVAGAAWGTQGVSIVIDKLQIEPYV
jgi:osmotically-inducible protein OsmY